MDFLDSHFRQSKVFYLRYTPPTLTRSALSECSKQRELSGKLLLVGKKAVVAKAFYMGSHRTKGPPPEIEASKNQHMAGEIRHKDKEHLAYSFGDF